MPISATQAGAATIPPALADLCEALCRIDDFDAALRAIDDARSVLLGAGHLTVNMHLTPGSQGDEVMVLQRLWSGNSNAYPVSGRKLKPPTDWSIQVLRRGEVFVGEGDAAIAGSFDDHAQIKALGLHAIVNVPIVANGATRATVNILTANQQWAGDQLAIAKCLALLGRGWILEAVSRSMP